MVFKFLIQMLKSPRGSYLELRDDCKENNNAWLFGALRIFSRGLTFNVPFA